jgi:PAS domain S-box-containing protein
VSQLVIFAHDVTRLKQDERKLQESEERYRAAIENSNDGVVIVRAGKLLFCNRKFVEMLGYDTAGEIDALQIASIIHPEDRARAVKYARRRQRGEPAPAQYEMRLLRKDGGTVHAESSSARIIIDGEPASLGFIRDITERKEVEEERMKLSSAVETAGEGIFMLTTDRRYSYANAAWRGIFGFTEKEILGQSSAATRSASYPESLRKAIWTQLEAGNTWSGRQTRTRKDGTPVEVETTIAPVKDGAGAIIQYVGVERDITRQLEIEAQFLQAQKMEAIGTLAGGVAHDFNNILTVIMGFGNMIQDNIEISDRIKPYIDQIVASCAKAADLTRSLLAYSRKQSIALEAHRMGELVTNTANLLKRLLPEDVDLKLDLREPHAVALVDVAQIDQVLMNLATNARDAMPHGGTLTIRLRTTQLDSSFSDSHGFGKPGSYVQLSVADTGTGMDEKTLARIFDPFFTTKEVGRGTGLGLSSVYGIVKQHKGYITVASAPLRGTVFDIYLPLAKGTVVPENIASGPAVGGTEAILVVEDDTDVRRMLVAVLTGQDYTILEAVDGDDAINVFNAHKEEIDLIILDVIMPGMNGKEVLDEIRRTSPAVKAIFMSGYAGDILFIKGVKDEGIEFMQKPISVPDLLGRIRHVLDT